MIALIIMKRTAESSKRKKNILILTFWLTVKGAELGLPFIQFDNPLDRRDVLRGNRSTLTMAAAVEDDAMLIALKHFADVKNGLDVKKSRKC